MHRVAGASDVIGHGARPGPVDHLVGDVPERDVSPDNGHADFNASSRSRSFSASLTPTVVDEEASRRLSATGMK
jgi:hypothetical protein